MRIGTRLLACAAPIVAAMGAASGTASATPVTPTTTATPAQVAVDGANAACETAHNLGHITGTPLPGDCTLPPTPRT